MLLATPGEVEAQACCAGAAAGQLGRLTLHEEALLGLDLKATRTLGAYGDDTTYRTTRSDELQFEQSLLATLRLEPSLQVGMVIPLVQRYARTPLEEGLGGGLGDLQLLGRYDFTFAGQSLRIPGMALLGGLGLPTGRPVEETSHPLGVEATGTGRTRFHGGVGIEQSFGMLFAQLMGALLYDAPRSTRRMEFEGRWGAHASLSLGASFPSELTLALSVRHEVEPSRRQHGWRYGFSAGYPFSDWRFQGGFFTDLPLDALGRNRSAQLGFHLALMKVWT